MSDAAVSVHDVERIYSTRSARVVALHAVTFTVAAGDAIAITGPSGVGKTSLLYLVAGLDRPTAGQIRVLDHPLNALSERALTRFRARHIGLVFQDPYLLPGLTALENVVAPDPTDAARLADPTDAARLAAARPGPGPSRAMRRLVAAAAVLLVATAVTIAVPSSRQAVASWFAFAGVDVRSGPSQSTSRPVDPVTRAPLAAGNRVTLDQAQRATADRVRVPADLAAPDRVFLRRDGAAVIVTIAYRTASTLTATPDTGYALLVTEIFDAGEPVLRKILAESATATAVQVNGRSGVFVAGPQQVIMLDHARTSHGQPTLHEVSARASANTLIWGDGATTYRLEGDFSQPVALTLSEGLR